MSLSKKDDDTANARVALLQYGGKNEQAVAFTLTYNLTEISQGLSRLTYFDSSSNIGNAIIYAINNILQDKTRGARRFAETSFVLITDGVTGDEGLKEAVSAMKKNNVVSTLVSVGTDLDMQVLKQLSLGESAAIFKEKEYARLTENAFLDRFVRWVC